MDTDTGKSVHRVDCKPVMEKQKDDIKKQKKLFWNEERSKSLRGLTNYQINLMEIYQHLDVLWWL